MSRFTRFFIILCFGAFFCGVAQAAPDNPEQDSYAYYGFDPDIITNYVKAGKTLGYIRVSVEIRVPHKHMLETVEHNSPLLRDAIIKILGSQSEQEIRSLTGREEIRKKCLTTANDLLFQETGEKSMLDDLIFTKYLYQ